MVSSSPLLKVLNAHILCMTCKCPHKQKKVVSEVHADDYMYMYMKCGANFWETRCLYWHIGEMHLCQLYASQIYKTILANGIV